MKYSEKERKNSFLRLLDDNNGSDESRSKIEPRCPHFKEGCGGCLMQDYNYDAQLKAKEDFLEETYKDALPTLGFEKDGGIRVFAAQEPLGYRSRMDFVTAFGKVGLRRRASFSQVIDVNECHLLPEKARHMMKIARDFLLASDMRQYNYIRHEGFIRYCVIRASKATGQVMLIITTKKPESDEQDAHVKDLLVSLFELTKADSLYWTINDTMTDISVGEPYWHLGEKYIIDEIAQNRFFITPQTFFQGNPVMAGELFDRAMRFVKGRTLDLCCGVGVLTILAAQEEDADDVVGVEINPASIVMAKDNMLLNEVTIDKCEFVCADMAKYLKERSRGEFYTVICDPARPGLGKDTCDELLRILPERIVYISCNPISHRDDLSRLSSAYKLIELEGFDLFPQTPHIEVLSVLEKR